MNESSNRSVGQNIPADEIKTPVGQSRREALAKMGVYAAYTAPLLLGMMTSAQAQVASGSTPGTTEPPPCE